MESDRGTVVARLVGMGAEAPQRMSRKAALRRRSISSVVEQKIARGASPPHFPLRREGDDGGMVTGSVIRPIRSVGRCRVYESPLRV